MGKLTKEKRVVLSEIAEEALARLQGNKDNVLKAKLSESQKELNWYKQRVSELTGRAKSLEHELSLLAENQQQALDDFIEEPEVSLDELIGYAMRRFDEDMEANPMFSIYAVVSKIVGYTKDFYNKVVDNVPFLPEGSCCGACEDYEDDEDDEEDEDEAEDYKGGVECACGYLGKLIGFKSSGEYYECRKCGNRWCVPVEDDEEEDEEDDEEAEKGNGAFHRCDVCGNVVHMYASGHFQCRRCTFGITHKLGEAWSL